MFYFKMAVLCIVYITRSTTNTSTNMEPILRHLLLFTFDSHKYYIEIYIASKYKKIKQRPINPFKLEGVGPVDNRPSDN